MRFSLSTESAIHGLLYLAVRGEGETVLLPDLARKMRVSAHTLRKVFQALANAEILRAFRGVNGGYRLGRDPGEITLRDIVDAVEGSYPPYHCVLRRRKCTLGEECAVGCVLRRMMATMDEALEGVTLEDLAASLRSHEKRLSWVRV